MSTEAKRDLWGAETEKAIANFPVSGEPIPVPVARWLGRIKAAAARANAELGLLDAEKAERIAAAAEVTMLSDRRAALEGIGLTFAEGLAREAEIGRDSIEAGIRGASRFAAGEGRGAEGV